MNKKVDVGFFEKDRFETRRANFGSGNPYDPESLLTGEEMALGLDYDCPREWSSQGVYDRAVRGEYSPVVVALIAPRKKKGERKS